MQVLISIIVPVYNVEKYLDKCIQSILSQSYRDFELLLIDDGSTDTSGSICDKYASMDTRVRVFHKENGGVSSARNLGIKEAIGDWITFIDSDDWIYADLLKSYINHFSYHADLYIQGFIDSNGNQFVEKEAFWNGDDLIVKIDNIEHQLIGFVWNKLFRASIIKNNQLFFDEKITMIEDLLFVYNYMIHADSVLNIPHINYYYWRHETSACFKKHSFDSWDNLIDKFYAFMMPFYDRHRNFADRKLKVFYELSLDVLRSLYIDRLDTDIRLSFLRKLKKRAERNDLIRIGTMSTLNNKLITGIILYFPVVVSDKLLLIANKAVAMRR